MVIWSRFKGGCAKVWGGTKRIAKKCADTVKSGVKYAKDKSAKVWSYCTGKDTHDEAMRRYQLLEERFEKLKYEYDNYIDNVISDISAQTNSINKYKKHLVMHSFIKFKSATSRVAEWDIISNTISNAVNVKTYSIECIRDRSSVVALDFDKNKFKTGALAILTLGFYTRSKAKDTRENVIAEEEKFKHEKAKIAAEKTKYNSVLKSLININSYFENLITVYDRLIAQVDYSINMVNSSLYLINPNHSSEKIDCYYLPKKHLLALMAADKMTRILHDMVESTYLSADVKLVKKDFVIAKEHADNYTDVFREIAA